MPSRSSLSLEEKDLVRRYLIWCYKTTKEELDRIDRKFTQLTVDRFMMDALRQAKVPLAGEPAAQYAQKVDGFRQYIEDKEKSALGQKFLGTGKNALQPGYLYLRHRLEAIEKAVVHFLGAKELKSVRTLYENEMTRRILEARDHS